jgi:hypothetical protein
MPPLAYLLSRRGRGCLGKTWITWQKRFAYVESSAAGESNANSICLPRGVRAARCPPLSPKSTEIASRSGSQKHKKTRVSGGAGGNRTPVHKSYATRSTYVAQSIVLTAHYPTGRESVQPARYFFVEPTPGTCVLLADERYTQTFASARDAWVSTAIRRLERSCLDWQL